MDAQWFVGIVLPVVIDYANKDCKTDEEKIWITILSCFAVACWFDWNLIIHGTFTDATQVFVLAGVLIAEAISVYKLYWQSSRLRVLLPGNGVTAKEEQG